MTGLWIAVGVLAVLLVALVAGSFLAMATGRLHLDLGWGRSLHQLGPLAMRIEAPRELVYEILSAPYLGRARNDSIDVLARGESLVVASHLTNVHFYKSRTVEAFGLERDGEETQLHYDGELGIDFFLLGRIAGRRWVVPQWRRAVGDHLEAVKALAEQRAQRARSRHSAGGAG